MKKEEKTLMELVESCEKVQCKYENEKDNIAKAEELKSLGFTSVAENLLKKSREKVRKAQLSEFGYIAITPQKIQDYLKMKVDRYNSERKNPLEKQKRPSELETQGRISPEEFQVAMANRLYQALSVQSTVRVTRNEENAIFTKETKDYHSDKPDTIGMFCWTETKTENYKTIPPDNVLTIMKEHKDRQVFDYFTIASVNAVHDPLLLGRIEGDENRYFIAQWGDDIQLDDIM